MMLKVVQVLVLAVLCSSTQGMCIDIIIYIKIKPNKIVSLIRQTSSS